jgi:hypothetical protein
MQAGRKSPNRTIDVYDVLPPEPTSRRQSVRQQRPVLVEDAVFEIVPPSPRPRSYNDNPAPKPASAASGEQIDLARLAAIAGVHVINRLERLLRGLSTQAFATLSVAMFFIVFWLCGGFGALDQQPITRPASAFVIDKVFTEEVEENGMRLIAIGGMLRNHSGGRLEAPSLSVVGEGGKVIGAITPVNPQLEAGQSARFFGRFRLASGKSGAVTIFPIVK